MEAVIEVFSRSNRLESKRTRSQASVQVDRKRDSVTISIRTNNTHDVYISRSVQPSISENGTKKGVKVYIPEYRTYIHLSATESQSIDDIFTLLSTTSFVEKENASPNIDRIIDRPKQSEPHPISFSISAGITRPPSTLSKLIKSSNVSSSSFVSSKKLNVKPPLEASKRSPPKPKYLASPEGGSSFIWARSPGAKKGKFGSPGDKFKLTTSSNVPRKVAAVESFRVASEEFTPLKYVSKVSMSQGIHNVARNQNGGKQLIASQFRSPLSGRSPGRTPYKITDEQEAVLKACCEDTLSIFFSGSAGTGKSSLLKVIIQALYRKHGANSVFVTATTGLAACAIDGTTVHQFAGISVAHESESGTLLQIANKVNNLCVFIIRRLHPLIKLFLDQMPGGKQPKRSAAVAASSRSAHRRGVNVEQPHARVARCSCPPGSWVRETDGRSSGHFLW